MYYTLDVHELIQPIFYFLEHKRVAFCGTWKRLRLPQGFILINYVNKSDLVNLITTVNYNIENKSIHMK